MENKTIEQSKLFGNTQRAFDMGTLKKLLAKELNDEYKSFTKSKEYFLTYYAKSLSDCYYKFSPSEDEEDNDGTIENISETEMNSVFKQIGTQEYHIEGNEKAIHFSMKKWFTENHYETYKINCDPRANKFYISKKTGQRFINLSKGFLHKIIKSFESYPQEIKDNVQLILDHIKNVWNSGNKEAYEFCLKWLAFACTGHKMNTALFLKSAEGTGKSVIVEFLVKYVIGESLGLITSRAESLMKFNSHLLGRILVCLEELPSSTKNAWFSISDYLKDLITGSKIDIEKKYQDMIQTVNLISLIIITNNENSIRFGKDIRRYMMCDISHDCVGNTKYFDKLADVCNKQTGEALYMYFIELCEKNKNWNPAEIPMTLNKLEMKESNETELLKYIKESYLKNGRGLSDPNHKEKMIKLNDLKDRFNKYMSQDLTTKKFNLTLNSDIPIVKVRQYGKEKQLFIEPVSFDSLKAYYIKRGFWNDKYDDLNKGVKVEENKGDDKTVFQENQELKEKIIELEKRLKQYESNEINEEIKMTEDLVNLQHIYDQMHKRTNETIQKGLSLFDGPRFKSKPSKNPFLININFEYDEKNFKNVYDDEHINDIITIANEYLSGKTKIIRTEHGFKIMYLECENDKDIFDKIKQTIIDKHLFSNVPMTNTYHEVIRNDIPEENQRKKIISMVGNQHVKNEVKNGEEIEFKPEPENTLDKRAIAIYSVDRKCKLGYVKKPDINYVKKMTRLDRIGFCQVVENKTKVSEVGTPLYDIHILLNNNAKIQEDELNCDSEDEAELMEMNRNFFD